MLEVKNLTKKFGDKYAVNNISFTVNQGEVVGFLGTNGAGKSTTMNMITGYLGATSGDITIDQNNILENPEAVKRNIGYLPEHPPLYQELTVWESLSFVYDLKSVKADKKKHLEEIAQMVSIYDVKDKLVGNLSKGYKQRVGIACALIGDPPILILDEPTVGLDPKQIIEIRSLISNLSKDKTVILSSHILQEIEAVCDRIIIIHQGVCIADDTPDNLLSNNIGDYNIIIGVIGDDEEIRKVIERVPDTTVIKTLSIPEIALGYKEFYISSTGKDYRGLISQILVAAGIELLELHRIQSSLEDVFLKLTSQREKSIEEHEMYEKVQLEEEGDMNDDSSL